MIRSPFAGRAQETYLQNAIIAYGKRPNGARPDIDQNVYIRRVDKVNGQLQNTELAVYPMVRDPDEK
jgi:hypothetical protein